MLSCVKILFVESPYRDMRILGRSAGEYLLREFRDYDCETVSESTLSDYVFSGELTVIIPFDMPLVREEDIVRAVESMRKRKLRALALGERESGAKIAYENTEACRYFASAPVFTKLGGAKNYNIVYNTLRERIIDRLLDGEVTVLDRASVHVDDTVTVSAGASILPFTRIIGRSEIGCGAVVEASYVEDSTVGEGATVGYSHLVGSRVGARTTVGPFARLRGAEIADGCRIGDFVEIKGSKIGEGVKAAHLTYIGDAGVGAGTNVGCGTVFCNYDGRNKHRTEIGENCFIGANVNLIAPLKIGEGSFIAAGTTVNRDLDADSFTIGRVKQESKKRTPAKRE